MRDYFLERKLNERREQQAFRQLRLREGKVDFCSNDYLGITTRGLLEKGEGGEVLPHGSGGSRLLSGNYPLIESTEKMIAAFHLAEAGLLFNSGYDANIGLLSCIAQRGDTILYDQLSHASIRDGVRLSFARSFSFDHNDCADLEKKLQIARGKDGGAGIRGAGEESGGTGARRDAGGIEAAAASEIFVVTESVFSMDGDQAPLAAMTALCGRYGAQLIVDEAHATGVVGPSGEGLVQALGLQDDCLARVHTFGKAVGCHGAIVLGSTRLRDYLINFCRAFIYTTAVPPASVRAIGKAYALFPGMNGERRHLQELIDLFQKAPLGFARLASRTPIQVIIVPGNEAVKAKAACLQDRGLDVRPILYPTVPKGSERLRIVLHAFNTMGEVDELVRQS